MAVSVRYFSDMRDVLSGRRNVYYGWWVLGVGTIAMALGSGLSMSAFGLYVKPLEEEFGWDRAQVSLGFSAAVLASGLTAPLIGHWVDSRGARSAILIGSVLAALSYVLLAMTQTLWQYYLFYGFHALARQMMFFLPFQALMSQWFDRKRGVALSILGSGFSLGSFLVLPIVAIVIGGLGWRGAYLFSGAVVAAFFIPVSLLVIRNRPADKGLHVDGLAERVDDAGVVMRTAANTGMTLRQVTKLPVFWIYGAGFMLLFFGMMGWQLHQVPFYESVGMSRATAAFIVSTQRRLQHRRAPVDGRAGGALRPLRGRYGCSVRLPVHVDADAADQHVGAGNRGVPVLLGDWRQRGADGRIAGADQGVRRAPLRDDPGRGAGDRDVG